MFPRSPWECILWGPVDGLQIYPRRLVTHCSGLTSVLASLFTFRSLSSSGPRRRLALFHQQDQFRTLVHNTGFLPRHGKSSMPRGVTYVLGLFCNPCPRSAPIPPRESGPYFIAILNSNNGLAMESQHFPQGLSPVFPLPGDESPFPTALNAQADITCNK